MFALSGLVDQRVTLLRQDKGTIFAGPASGCSDDAGPCSPDYPTFRYLALDDIPDLGSLYVSQDTNMGIDASTIPAGSVSLYKESGVITYDPKLVFLKTHNRLGVNIDDPRTTLDVNGAASVSGDFWASGDSILSRDLVVGRNATISGNLDVRGDLTYVDSSTVTIWDKNLELASMSGTALYNDASVDDAGIVIKSTDTDKKWTWRDSTDAWTTDQKISVSGLVLPGNIFQIGDNAANSGDIHTKYLLSVSGVSGVYTEFVTDAASNSGALFINVSGVSGYFDAKIASLGGGYNYWSVTDGKSAAENITTTEVLTISGVSGVVTQQDGNFLRVSPDGLSGVLRYDIDNVTAGFNITDGTVPADSIANSDTVTISGVSGILTHYNSTTNTLVLNPSGLSGVLTHRDTAISGYIDGKVGALGGGYGSWSLTDGLVAADAITSLQTVTISGSSGVGTHYDASSNMLTLNPSGLSGVMQSQIDGISVGSSAAGSGLTKVGTTIHMDIDGSGQLEHLIFNADQIRIGTNAGDSFDLGDSGSYWVAIGTAAGYGASGNDSTVMIGQDAGKLSSGCDYTNMIGSGAGLEATGCTESTIIGRYAGRKANSNLSANMIGWNAGNQATGCNYTHMIGGNAGAGATGCVNEIMIGWNAGYQRTGCQTGIMIGKSAGSFAYYSHNNYSIGYAAGQFATGCDYSNSFGYYAGTAFYIDQSNMIGYNAGRFASGCDYANMIGKMAGSSGTALSYADMIGHEAGARASGCGNIVAIGRESAYGAFKSSHNVALGRSTGSGTLHVDHTNMMGYQAGINSSGNYSTTLIGVNAGKDSAHAVTGVYLGESAAAYGSGLKQSVGIGLNAFAQATGIQNSVALGHSAGTYAEDIKFSDMIGRHAGQAASGLDYGTVIGYKAGASSTGCDYSIFIGAEAGSGVDQNKNSIFLGYRAGFGMQVNTDNHLVINPSNRVVPTTWTTSALDGYIDIADIIHGRSDGTSSKNLNIGNVPNLTDLLTTTLSINPAAPTDVVLKTRKQSAQSADQIQSSITSDGWANTIVNRYGWLQLPVAKRVDGSAGSKVAWTDASSTDQKYKIDREAGVVALYEDGSDWRLIVTNGTTWFKTDALTEM